jgi:hypothetical protein
MDLSGTGDNQGRRSAKESVPGYELRVLHRSRFRFGRWSGWTMPCFWKAGKAAELNKAASNQQHHYGPAFFMPR